MGDYEIVTPNPPLIPSVKEAHEFVNTQGLPGIAKQQLGTPTTLLGRDEQTGLFFTLFHARHVAKIDLTNETRFYLKPVIPQTTSQTRYSHENLCKLLSKVKKKKKKKKKRGKGGGKKKKKKKKKK